MTTTTAHPVIIDSKSGHLVANTTKPFIVALNYGENLFEGLLRVATDANLTAASLSGLGAVDDVTLAYYHLDKKEYATKLFKGTFELVSLNGNLAFFEGKPFLHIHGALGTESYDVVGGHFMDAHVGPSVEITVLPITGKIERQHSEKIGLKLMCPIGGRC